MEEKEELEEEEEEEVEEEVMEEEVEEAVMEEEVEECWMEEEKRMQRLSLQEATHTHTAQRTHMQEATHTHTLQRTHLRLCINLPPPSLLRVSRCFESGEGAFRAMWAFNLNVGYV